MRLFPDIDQKASRDQARSLLKEYRKLARIAQQPLNDIKSPTISDMPKARPSDNTLEHRLTDTINAKQAVESVIQAMALLPVTSYWVLYYSYCNKSELTYSEIADRIAGYSSESIKDLKRKALLEFAEAYHGQRLLVFTKTPN